MRERARVGPGAKAGGSLASSGGGRRQPKNKRDKGRNETLERLTFSGQIHRKNLV